MRYEMGLLFTGLAMFWLFEREPTLEARSLIELHGSWERMERELHLSAADSAALEEAIDTLVGEAARQLISVRETKYQCLSEADRRRETEILAPLQGLAFDQVLAAAKDRVLDEKGAVLAALAASQAVHREEPTPPAVRRSDGAAALKRRLRDLDETLRSFDALMLAQH